MSQIFLAFSEYPNFNWLLRHPVRKISVHRTKVHSASFLSGGFIAAIVVNAPEKKLAKRISVHCCFFCVISTKLVNDPTSQFVTHRP